MIRYPRLAISLFAWSLHGGLLLGQDEQPIVIRLQNGREVSGRILVDGFDEATGITMRRDDNGGRLALRWDQIRSEDRDAIKRSRGFVGDEPPAVMVDAIEVTLKGANQTPLVGINLGTEGDKIQLSRLGEVTPVPLSSIRTLKNIRIDALEVENPASVYQRHLLTAAPQNAVEWYNLGLFAESLTLFDEAEECYQRTLEVEPGFSKANLIQARVKNLAVKRKEAEATEMLRRIDTLARKGLFAEAIARVDEFKEKWPRSLQQEELHKKEADIARRRRASLLLKIREDFFSILWREAEKKAREPEIELGKAMTWAEEDAYDAVVRGLVDLYQTSAEEINDLWANRGVSGVPNNYSYGGGTFILGTDARKGMIRDPAGKKAAADDKAAKDGDPTAKKSGNTIMNQIQKALEQKAKDREASKEKKDDGTLADVPPTPEDWWLAAPLNERRGFLLAFFTEHSKPKHVEVIRIGGRDCTTCFGKGNLEFGGGSIGSTGNNNSTKKTVERVPCPRCKRLGFDRVVTAR